jgi:hypothetical protein
LNSKDGEALRVEDNEYEGQVKILNLRLNNKNKSHMSEERSEDDAPLFKKWSYWYALVIGFLVILVVFFYLLTKHFA